MSFCNSVQYKCHCYRLYPPDRVPNLQLRGKLSHRLPVTHSEFSVPPQQFLKSMARTSTSASKTTCSTATVTFCNGLSGAPLRGLKIVLLMHLVFGAALNGRLSDCPSFSNSVRARAGCNSVQSPLSATSPLPAPSKNSEILFVSCSDCSRNGLELCVLSNNSN